jgi:hypothetical protein
MTTVALTGTAMAYTFPSTNDQNRDLSRPHVNLVSTGVGEVTLEFTNATSVQLSYFEVRIDGEATGTTAHPVVDGDTIHLGGVCVDTRASNACPAGPRVVTFNADETVEIRLALGGERDWDFDWTSFAVLPNNPQSKDECKKGGWEAFGFENQGQCIRYVNTGKDSRV